MGSSLLPQYRKPMIPGSTLIQAFDPDASAFFAKGVSLGQPPLSDSIKNAINTYVLAKKAAGIWIPGIADYPFVGGTAVWHSLNLRDPDQYQITWGGTVTHNANGITGNGTDGYGDTGIDVDTLPYLTSLAFGIYSRTNSAITGSDIGAGATDAGGSTFFQIFPKFTDNNAYFDNNVDARISVAMADSRGLFSSSRTASNSHIAYRNATNIVSTTAASSSLLTGQNFLVLACTNLAGAPFQFSSRNLCSAYVSAGLTGANMNSLYNAQQTLQTELGRQV